MIWECRRLPYGEHGGDSNFLKCTTAFRWFRMRVSPVWHTSGLVYLPKTVPEVNEQSRPFIYSCPIITACSHPTLQVPSTPIYTEKLHHAAVSLFLLSHSSGVKHFGVQACIAAISCFSAVLTSRCLASAIFFANWGETMTASNI
jgi:hypothetical protein